MMPLDEIISCLRRWDPLGQLLLTITEKQTAKATRPVTAEPVWSQVSGLQVPCVLHTGETDQGMEELGGLGS